MRRPLLLAPLLLVVLALSACFGTPTASTTTPPPTSKPTTTATATPTPSSSPVAAPKIALASISATSEGMTLTGADGSTLAHLDYFQPQASAIAALTDGLGFAPQQVDKPGTPNSDNVATTLFDFEGLQVLGPPIDSDIGWLFRLNITVAAVRGIPITTIDGIQAGADAPSLESAYAQYARRIGSRLLIAVPGPSGYGVAMFADDPTTSITSILVPAGV